MPELPEVETICRGLRTRILNIPIADVIVRDPKLRWPVPKELKSLLSGKSFIEITRRGKYLILSVVGGAVIIHLGLSGQLLILPCEHEPDKHEHLMLCFKNGMALCYVDARKFGAFLWTDKDPFEHKLLKSLGPEPLTNKFDSEYLFSITRSRKISIKQLLMDSHIVAGVGNIYASEALFFAGVSPLRNANSLTIDECANIVISIKKVLQKAIKKGGTTIKDYVASDGNMGNFQLHLRVYGRDGKKCLVCKSDIKKVRQSGRSTFYCSNCQK